MPRSLRNADCRLPDLRAEAPIDGRSTERDRVTKETTQPQPDGGTLVLFAKASIGLSKGFDEPAFRQHAENLALLARSDLVLIYEAGPEPDVLVLLAQWGVPLEAQNRFQVLGIERSSGAGGLRTNVDSVAPTPYLPLTDDLVDLGIRACWAYPLWSDGVLKGQVFFGSRDWDRFHEETLAVFAATTLQIAQALDRRADLAHSTDRAPTWSDAGGTTAASKRRQFIAVLAHELRNPIAPIRSGLDLLTTGLLSDEGRTATIDMMQRQVAHLVRLIDDLLDTVRLDTGRLQVKRQPVLLEQVVDSAIESIRPALAAKRQTLKLDGEYAAVIVDVDPVRLTQAFVNILNANVKQTPEHGTVTVSVTSREREHAITFEDEGPGLTSHEISNVFELFPTSAEHKSEDGLGIGLALVKGLVELNDGRIELGNRETVEGTIYTVWIPRTSIDMVGAQADADDALRPELLSHRVLIVDDNRDAADTLGLLLELDGHTIRLAHDGPSAVREAMEFQPEVIFMDIGLPVFNGNEATKQIRAHNGSVRPFIVALTGWGAVADKQATRSAGCDLHLVKPVPLDQLREIIAEVTRIRGGGGDD
jgi:signal transduction histidine kinase/CheY-like chemotaxis protein